MFRPNLVLSRYVRLADQLLNWAENQFLGKTLESNDQMLVTATIVGSI